MTTTIAHAAYAWKSEDAAISAAARSCRDSRVNDWARRVGERAYAERSCIWHAAHLVSLDMYATGELPTATCGYCGGRADVALGFHHMCKALFERGLTEIPRLDIVDAMRCDCTPCARARGDHRRFF